MRASAKNKLEVVRTDAPDESAQPDLLDSLREQIVSHRIPPGSRLREQQLVDDYGVARSKVRDVLAALEQRGLVERIPNRGAIVVKLDTGQVADIYLVREVLEGLMVRLATEKSSPESWQDLLEEFEGPMRTYVEKSDFEAFVEGYEKFRRRVLEAADNPALEQVMDGIYEKTHMIIRRVIVLPGRASDGLRQHTAVLQAMCRGDALEAERLRRENMRSAREVILRFKNFIL
jgi:DNA-binding GntR family transcriptional regulator